MLKQLHYCLNIHTIVSTDTFVLNAKQLFNGLSDFFTHFSHSNYLPVTLSLLTLIVLFGLHFWSHSKVFGAKNAKQIPAVLLGIL